MLSGQVPLSFYKVGTIRSDIKPYQKIPLFQKFSKIKIKAKNTPLEDVVWPHKTSCPWPDNL